MSSVMEHCLSAFVTYVVTVTETEEILKLGN